MYKNSGVYKFRNIINGKIYIGSSCNCKNRERVHLKSLRNNIHHSITFQRAFNKYGEENFVFEILEYVEIKENETKVEFGKRLTKEREQFYLNKYGGQEFIRKESSLFIQLTYNISPTAGSALGTKRPKLSKNKYKESLINDPTIIERQKVAHKKTLIDNPEIVRVQSEKRKKTYSENPEIMQRQKECLKQTLAKRPLLTCPHCNYESKNKGNMIKCHFDNCTPEMVEKSKNNRLKKEVRDLRRLKLESK